MIKKKKKRRIILGIKSSTTPFDTPPYPVWVYGSEVISLHATGLASAFIRISDNIW